MDAYGSGRRQFLKQAAALAGVAAGTGAGAEWAAKGESAHSEAEHSHVQATPSRRGARMTVDHITYYTPLQDYSGIITPSRLHFVQYHASHFPEIDVQQH